MRVLKLKLYFSIFMDSIKAWRQHFSRYISYKDCAKIIAGKNKFVTLVF